MSGSSAEKTEQPTDKKLKDARKKGQVAQSQDINKLFITAVGFELLIALKDSFLERVYAIIEVSLQLTEAPFSFAAKEVARHSFQVALFIVLILLFAVIVARIIGGWIQFGLLIAPEAVRFDITKLNPVTNAKNIFSMKKVVELLANIAKAIVLSIVFYLVVKSVFSDIILTSMTTLDVAVKAGIDIFILAARVSLFIFLILAIIDFMAQKYFFIKSQKMTKDEVFREYKQMEGDPYMKGIRKSFGRELVESEPTEKNMKSANAVVVNPTHFAVALRYVPGETPLPKVICKGVDEKAQYMIQIAKQNKIPVIRYVWLARTLFRVGKENQYIPREVIKPMAVVFKAVKEMKVNGKHEMSIKET